MSERKHYGILSNLQTAGLFLHNDVTIVIIIITTIIRIPPPSSLIITNHHHRLLCLVKQNIEHMGHEQERQMLGFDIFNTSTRTLARTNL